MTTVMYPHQQRAPRPQTTWNSITPESAREAARTSRQSSASVKHDWPRPPLVHDRTDLFREPTYEDGQPYADNHLEDDEPSG